MAIYKFTIQSRTPWYEGPQAFYYWSNIYYADIRNEVDYDFARDYVGNVTNRFHNSLSRLDWLLVTEYPGGDVIQDTSFTFPANTLRIGDIISLENTIYVGLYAGGKQVGFKRFRGPVRKVDHAGAYFTSSALTYYQNAANIMLTPQARFCTRDGVFFDSTKVYPKVANWQLRHGSKRARYRRLQ